jgi:hypothetical protein
MLAFPERIGEENTNANACTAIGESAEPTSIDSLNPEIAITTAKNEAEYDMLWRDIQKTLRTLGVSLLEHSPAVCASL